MAKDAKGRSGRPQGSVADRRRDAKLLLSLYPEEKAAYKAAADRLGLSIAAWIRMRLNVALKEDSQ